MTSSSKCGWSFCRPLAVGRRGTYAGTAQTADNRPCTSSKTRRRAKRGAATSTY